MARLGEADGSNELHVVNYWLAVTLRNRHHFCDFDSSYFNSFHLLATKLDSRSGVPRQQPESNR
ncbi:hypothetical protein SAMN05216338_10798 [Bradyrhizobium sp. Rc2d]|nr:hypothetical protein SAMN05216338_10798 [Bradyrhizobium sp. Rc2d]